MHEGHRNRLRDRAISQGLDSLETHEILELFLYSYIPRKDTNSIAYELLNTFGSFSKVIDADVEELIKVSNMTTNAAVALHSIPHIIKRYIKDKNSPKKNLSTIVDAVEFMHAETKFLTKERLYILCLDSHFNLVKSVIIKSESVDRVNISMKEIHSAVLRHNTRNIILSHNHPAGSLLPSDEDVTLTKDIIMSMSYIDVEVLDHIIVTDDNYFSFREKGLLYELMPKNDISNHRLVAEKQIGVRYED